MNVNYFKTLWKSSLMIVMLCFGLTSWGQTSVQNFGIITGTHSSTTQSTNFIPNPTSGTTYVRGGGGGTAPIVLATVSNPLGTTDTYVRAVASSSTSVAKFSPAVGYAGSTEFYTSFKVLFGSAIGEAGVNSGSWTFYQGSGNTYNNNSDFSSADVFTGLRFTYSNDVVNVTNRTSSWDNTGISITQGEVHTIEIIGNNSSSTINYTYNGINQNVASGKFDFYVDGILLGNDLTKGGRSLNATINSTTFIGISSTNNVANIFVDDVVIYNDIPESIGTSTQAATPTISASGTANGTDTYWDSAEITIETTTSDATIYYTVNDGDLLEYVSPFTITSTSTIEAYAVAEGLEDSEVATKTITITYTVPTITASTESITGLGYEFGSPTSTAQSFNLTGANLDGTESVMLFLDEDTNSDFEMSLDNVAYSTYLTIENFGNGSTPVYVRLKSGLAISADYLDMITILNGYNSDELNILVEGAVTPPAPTTTVSETALSGFTYVLDNGPSSEQSFTVEGSYLTSDITVTAPTNYQVSLSSGSGFQNSVTLTQTDGTVAETTVYVQLNAGLGIGNYNGNLTVATTGVANKTIALTGSVTCGASALPYSEDFESVTTPNVPNCTTVVQGGSGNLWTTSSPNESGFTSKVLTYQWHDDNDANTWFFTNGLQLEGGHSYRLSFRYGNNSTLYTENLRVAYGTSNSIVAMTTVLADYPNINDNTPHSVTINFEPDTTGTYYIGFQAYSLSDNYRLYVDDILVEENVPTISVEPVTVPAFTAVTDSSDSEDIIITGILLSDNIDIALSGINADQFSLSATSLDSAGGTLTVTYEPTTVGNHTATLTLSSTDATDVVLALNGTATLGTPVATAGSNETSNSFTANWEAVPGADSYEIDVYTKVGGGTEEDVEDFSGIVINGNQIGEGSIFNEGWSFLSAGTRQQYTSTSNYGASSPSFAFTLTGDYIQTAIYPNNIQSFSFWAKAQGGSTSSTLIEGFNGTSWVTIATLVNSSISSGTTIVYDLVDLEIDNIVQIRMVFTKNSGNLSIDDVTVTYEGTTLSPIAEDPFTVSAPATSLNVTDLDPETTYYYVVRAVSGEETSANSNEIEVETLAAPTAIVWMIDGGWSNLTGPTIDDDVIIEGELSIPTDFESFSAQTLTVEGSLTIEANASVTVEGKITNNGEFTVESDGILYQNNYTGTNEGNITVKRAANPMKRLDYTLWSSPVSGMLLNQFSNISNNGGTGTIWNRVYELGATAWESIWESYDEASTSTDTFVEAKGYLYRAFNSYDPVETTIFTGEFTGVPNNGEYSIDTPNTFDAIGNPYPSPISADDFITSNNADAIYFWTNVNSSNGTEYVYNNWATYTTMGGAGVTEGLEGETEYFTPEGTIQPGQGFVVYTEEDSVSFDNSMRINSNGQFFRAMNDERSRFWLNLSNEEVTFNQILVGYMDNATQGVDTGIDGKMFAYEGNALYSIIDNNEDMFVIQGRALPFTASDVVALGFRAVNAGSFTISLHNFDGLFANNQNIYLKDNFTQLLHNLKEGAYTFVSEEGIFNTRFEVVYQTTMSVENPIANNANWIVYSQENGYQIQTQGFELKSVQVFDLLGRTIYTASAEGTAHHIPSLGADSVYIVKVTTTDNVVLSKKVK